MILEAFDLQFFVSTTKPLICWVSETLNVAELSALLKALFLLHANLVLLSVGVDTNETAPPSQKTVSLNALIWGALGSGLTTTTILSVEC